VDWNLRVSALKRFANRDVRGTGAACAGYHFSLGSSISQCAREQNKHWQSKQNDSENQSFPPIVRSSRHSKRIRKGDQGWCLVSENEWINAILAPPVPALPRNFGAVPSWRVRNASHATLLPRPSVQKMCISFRVKLKSRKYASFRHQSGLGPAGSCSIG
jgi:hypothetical protein